MPKTYSVTRHAGAIDWLKEAGYSEACQVSHFDPTVVKPGDLVVGVLPVQLAAIVCEQGGKYLHLEMNVPADRRGTEVSKDDMNAFGAKLSAFRVIPDTL